MKYSWPNQKNPLKKSVLLFVHTRKKTLLLFIYEEILKISWSDQKALEKKKKKNVWSDFVM